MAGLGGGENALHAGEVLGGLEDLGLLNGGGLHESVVVELGQDRVHAVVAQTARVVGGGDETAAQGVHLGQGADHARVAVVVGELTAGKAGAGGGLDRNEAVVCLAAELLTHEGGNQTAKVGAAAGTTDNNVGLDTVLVHGDLGFQTDDGLVEHDLVQHAAKNVAVVTQRACGLHGLRDSTAERSAGAGVLLQDLAAYFSCRRRRRSHLSAVGTHDLAAKRLLLVADLDHVHAAVQTQIGASHGQCGSPLTGAGLGGYAGQSLLLGVVRLGNGGIEFMGARGVVALELVVDLGGSLQLLLQAVGAYQGRRAVHLVEGADLLGNLNVGGGIVQLLLDQLVAEHGAQVLVGHGLKCLGVEKRCGLILHVGAEVVPCLGHILLADIDLIGDFFLHLGCAHRYISPFRCD